jgi:allantoate deiminase
MTLTIDRERLLADLDALAQMGRAPDGGITRRALSREDADARAYVAARMKAAGMEVRHDEVGNLRALRRGRTDGPSVMTGSHLDSVPAGGRLDGPLGVVGAVVAVEALNAAGVVTEKPIEIAVFVGEEGSRFPRGTIGSAALSGHVQVAHILELRDADGIRYADALATYGDSGTPLPGRAEPGSIAAFVELHVEQGGVLETSGTPIGVVTAVNGLVQRQVAFLGDANHAGATPMHLRRDALLAAATWCAGIERAAVDLGEGAVGTVGKLAVVPGGKNIIPGRVEAICDLRAPTPALLSALDDRVVAGLRAAAFPRGVEWEQRLLQRVEPGPMAESAMAAVERATRAAGLTSQRMPSGAIHDALHMAECCAATMIFVPSIGGRSHCPTEDTDPVHLVQGCAVLAYSLVELAGG